MRQPVGRTQDKNKNSTGCHLLETFRLCGNATGSKIGEPFGAMSVTTDVSQLVVLLRHRFWSDRLDAERSCSLISDWVSAHVQKNVLEVTRKKHASLKLV